MNRYLGFVVICGLLINFTVPCLSQANEEVRLDQKVRAFLQKMKYQWRDMNVPEIDGKLLYDIIIKNQYRNALEVGTSTGHSTIWIAWALSKTGGKLTTVEIDEWRHQRALEYFKEAGVSEYIDARLADAHKLVHELQGPFDFVFIDADKGWYTNYAQALIPKLKNKGCMAAHNVYQPRADGQRRFRRSGFGTGDYYNFMKNQPEFETYVVPESQNGLAVSYKKKS